MCAGFRGSGGGGGGGGVPTFLDKCDKVFASGRGSRYALLRGASILHCEGSFFILKVLLLSS